MYFSSLQPQIYFIRFHWEIEFFYLTTRWARSVEIKTTHFRILILFLKLQKLGSVNQEFEKLWPD